MRAPAPLRPPWRFLLRVGRWVSVSLPAEIDGWRAATRDPLQGVLSWPPPPVQLGADVALFVHYDPDGIVRPRVLHYVAALRSAGFAVAFVSNAGRLREADLRVLRDVADTILVRRNVGYDFAAWREGLSHWGLPRANTRRLLLVNDSLAGPFTALAPLLRRMDLDAADLWAATDSAQRYEHLQSFFLLAGKVAMAHPAWAAFWASMRPVRAKEWVIAHGELGLTRRMRAAGLRCRAVFPHGEVLARIDWSEPPRSPGHQRQRQRLAEIMARRGAVNPSIDLWRELLRAGFPFIKRELLGRNPAGVLDVDDWRAEVSPDMAALDWS